MLLKGDVAEALKELRDQYDSGADPAIILSDLAEFTHFVTRVKLVPSVADDLSLSETERMRGKAFAAQLSMRILSRTWQMLLKGLAEVQQAARPVAAAEMLLVRIAYAADLPTPGRGDPFARRWHGVDAAAIVRAPRQWRRGVASFARSSRRRSHRGVAFEAPRGAAARDGRAGAERGAAAGRDRACGRAAARSLGSFEDWCSLRRTSATCRSRPRWSATCGWSAARTASLKSRSSRAPPQTLVNELSAQAARCGPAGHGWWCCRANPAQPTLKAQMDAREAELKRGVRADPLVQAVLERFPGAEIVAVRPREAELPIAEPESDTIPDRSRRRRQRQRKVGHGRFHGDDEEGGRAAIQDAVDAGRARDASRSRAPPAAAWSR